MGQYQQHELDLKGCMLELAQRNSQVSVPVSYTHLDVYKRQDLFLPVGLLWLPDRVLRGN